MKWGVSGGSKVREVLREIQRKVSRKDFVRVGFLEGATYPDGTPVAYIAAINEWGNPAHNQPPRPFFRLMIGKNSPGWGAKMAKFMKVTGCDADLSLNYMGESIKSELQVSIRKFDGVPLAPATIQAKGFNSPLIDSGHMLSSVDYQVKTKS